MKKIFLLALACVVFEFELLKAQGGNCEQALFSIENYQPCCYRVHIDNSSECYNQLRVVMDVGSFTDWQANIQEGWTGILEGPSVILLTHSSGIIPIGIYQPVEFCIETDTPPIISMLYDFTCGLGEGCFADFPVEACSLQDSCAATFDYLVFSDCGLYQFNSVSTGLQPLTFSWNFGDPNSGVSNNNSNLENPSHQFSALCQNYIVCLTVSAGGGCTASNCVELTALEFEPPSITCPSDIQVNCESNTNPGFTGFPTAVDNCDLNPMISYSDEEDGTFPCDYELVRTWSVADECGHINSCTQIITVYDTVPSLITCPADVVINAAGFDSCFAVVNNLQLLSINEACSNHQISYIVTGATTAQGQQNASGLVFNGGVSTVTYSVTDECGNTSSCSFNVTVICESLCPGNLIENYDFSIGTIAGPMPQGKVTDWNAGYGIPVVANDFGCGNNGYIALKGNKIAGDAIFQPLGSNIKKDHVYEMTACVRVQQNFPGQSYAKLRVMAFNGTLPSAGTHPVPHADHAIVDISGRIAACDDWVEYVFHRWRAPKDFYNIAIAVENSESPASGFYSLAEIDNICFSEVNDSIPCYLAEFDSQGNLIPPFGVIDTNCPILEDSVDIYMGNVNDIYAYCNPAPDHMDTWYEFCLDSCESIGGELPDELVDFINNDSMDQVFMDSFGVSVSTFKLDLNNFLDSLILANPDTNLIDDIMGLGPIAFDCRSLPAQGPPPNDADSPFNGRDIVFVHGLNFGPIYERMTQTSAGSQTTWPADRNEFYTGYWKTEAYRYWDGHTTKFLKTSVHSSTFAVSHYGSYSNRYLVVAHPATQSFVKGAHSVMEQIANAMLNGVGVINCDPGELRDENTFGHNGFIIISHSDGAPLSDIVLATSALTRFPPLNMMLGDVSFIADRCDVHVAVQGAFGGSDYASILLMAISTGAQYLPLAELILEDPVQGSTAWMFTSQLLDMAITKHLWGPVMNRVPVCVLTIAGGHPTDYGETDEPHAPALSPIVKHAIHQGFDDGVLSIESQTANPDSRSFYPDVYKPLPGILSSPTFNERIYDMGITKERGIRYYMDQKVDILTAGNLIKLPFASSGCVPWLSPTGMVQPVLIPLLPGVPGFDALKRYLNHYSFLQSTSDHYQGSVGDFGSSIFPNYPDYEKTYDTGSRNYEESRVVTAPDVYWRCGVNPLKLTQVEYVRGKKITFKIFKKSFTRWIWKRKYHVLYKYEEKNQLDYLYESLYK